MNSVILQAATRIALGLILLFSLYVLFRGHNDPGGGFIGALIACGGFALFTFAYGTARVRKALIICPRFICMAGVFIAMLSGLPALFFDSPFLTGLWTPAYLSGESDWPISTVLFFDIGVYLAVFGTVMSILLAIEDDA